MTWNKRATKSCWRAHLPKRWTPDNNGRLRYLGTFAEEAAAVAAVNTAIKMSNEKPEGVGEMKAPVEKVAHVCCMAPTIYFRTVKS